MSLYNAQLNIYEHSIILCSGLKEVTLTTKKMDGHTD